MTKISICESLVVLPKNHTISCLPYEKNTRRPYKDNLCFFRALALHLHDTHRLEEETSKILNFFIKKVDRPRSNQFQEVLMNDIPTVEDLLTLNILLFDIDFVDGNFIGELARQRVQKYDKTVRLLRYNNHSCFQH